MAVATIDNNPPTGEENTTYQPQPESASEESKARRDRLRKLRRYLAASHDLMGEWIYSTAPSLDVMDADRIAGCLALRLEEYDGAESRKEWRLWASEWVTRIAELTVSAKAIIQKLPELGTNPYVGRSLTYLPDYSGGVSDAEALRSWLTEWVDRQASNTAFLCELIDKNRRSVFDGLWSVLLGCTDLGVGKDVLADLSQEVWIWAFENADSLQKAGAPIHFRLREKAYWFARAWKTDRLRERDAFTGLEEADREQIKELHLGMPTPPAARAA